MVKKGKRGKKKNAKPVKGRAKQSKKSNAGRVFIYALALAALGGGGYLAYNRIKRKKFESQNLPESDTIIINNNLPATSSLTSSILRRATGNDNFPLKRGSRGTRVTMLQQALAKSNPAIKVDGQFGPATASALKSAGYSDTVDEAAFIRITGGSVQLVFNPVDIASRLYGAAQARNIETVLSVFKEIKSVQDYSSVNEYYKKQGFIISRTIVTDLLDYAFKDNESAKALLRNEFLRIGLKVSSEGTWSLQGIRLFRDLITIRHTVVTDASNNKIPVRRNTILGDEVQVANGMTWFRSIDNTILKVPTRDTKYT